MNPLMQAAITSILRWAFALGAGYLVHKGIWTSGDAATYVEAAALGLVSLAWSQRNMIQQRAAFLMALMMPHGTTENEVKSVIAAGAVTPALTTPPDTIPGVPSTKEVL